MENDVRMTGIVNWSQVARDGDGRSRATGEALLCFLDSGATEEEEKLTVSVNSVL